MTRCKYSLFAVNINSKFFAFCEYKKTMDY